MKPLALMLGVIALAVASAIAQAPFERRVTVSGTSTAGSSFDLEITSATDFRSIPMGPLVVDYTASAMASLMVSAINDDYRANGNTGFQATRIKKADGRTQVSETFIITSSSLITDIAVGPSGGAATAPRAPGLAFNPTLIDQEADSPTPYLGSQFGHPNANLTLNGLDPSANHFREVEVRLDPVTGGFLNLRIQGLANVPITFLGGPYGNGFADSPNGTFALFFGTPDQQTLDIGTPNPGGGLPLGLFTIADGIFNSIPSTLNAFFTTDATGDFVFPPFSVPASLDGFSGDGFQAILPDPSLPAPGLRFTQAAQPVYRIGRRNEVFLNSDGVAQINFLPGRTFDFYGAVSQTQINVFENGFMTFGSAAPPQGGSQIDVLGQLQGDPAIFVNWADWRFPQLGGLPVEGIEVYEFGDEIRFGWGFGGGGPAASGFGHAGDNDVAAFECILRLRDPASPAPDAGLVSFDFVQLDPSATFANDSVVGIAPGAGATGLANLDLGLNRFGPGPGAPLLQQSIAGGSSPNSIISLASGTGPGYSNGNGWSGRMIDFYPEPMTLPGQTPYYSIASEARPDDAAGLTPNGDAISASGGPGQILELFGYFLYAFDAGAMPLAQITLDPGGVLFAQPVTLQPGAVGEAATDSRLAPGVARFVPTGPFRSYEQLRVIVPDLAGLVPVGATLPAVVGLEVSFPGQAPIPLPGVVTITP